MKLAGVSFAGFRGARSTVSVDFAPGFVVIVGRNGTGKSTICDAIEYGLTGNLRPDAKHTENNEGILDYVWWRGRDDVRSERFVLLTLLDDNGREYRIRRTPAESEVPAGLDGLLCRNPNLLESPLAQLCRTTILRDEDITRLSIDLRETDRFDAVRSALGTADFSITEERASKVLQLLDKELGQRNQQYELIKSRVAQLTVSISQARTEAAQSGDLADAVRTLRELSSAGQDAPHAQLLSDAERSLVAMRVRIDALARMYSRLEEYHKRTAGMLSDARRQERERLTSSVTQAKQKHDIAAAESARASEALARAQSSSPANASLASLHEHGRRLGLVDGGCPLCGEKQTPEHYATHLAALASRLAAVDASISSLTKRAADAAGLLSQARADLSRAQAPLTAMEAADAEIEAERVRLDREVSALGVDVSSNTPPIQQIAALLDVQRKRSAQVERAIAVVRVSTAAERVSSLEVDLSRLRAELEVAERRVVRGSAAQHAAKEAVATVKRVRGEYVNEQLAQLEPLLLELYQRLRPHVDWPEVHYKLRGDVRRMLRLEVGDGLNPSFVFSSGQRRAAGLAFLLALHLARSWCSLNALVLDDPVQHIDDYRALHLAEVLAAIRVSKRQVICTVEDESLAKLLCRRLRSAPDSTGLLVRMGYSSVDGVHVASKEAITPMPRSILVPA